MKILECCEVCHCPELFVNSQIHKYNLIIRPIVVIWPLAINSFVPGCDTSQLSILRVNGRKTVCHFINLHQGASLLVYLNSWNSNDILHTILVRFCVIPGNTVQCLGVSVWKPSQALNPSCQCAAKSFWYLATTPHMAEVCGTYSYL